MNYTLDRFSTKRDKPLLEAVKDTMQISAGASTLEKLLLNERKRRSSNDEAKLAMTRMLALAAKAAPPEEENFDLLGKALGRLLKFVGKQVIKRIVTPILKFAGRVAMNVIRIAAQTLLRMVIIPVFQAVATFVLANPITAGVLLAVAAVGGGGYYLWKKFFDGEAKPQIVSPGIEPVDTTNVAEADTDVVGVGAQVVGSEQIAPQTETKSVYEKATTLIQATTTVVKPVEAISQFVTGKKKGKSKTGKFTGFGQDVDEYIREASAMFPILPQTTLRGFIKMEAGWTGAMSPTGAIGTGQFIQGTWDAMAKTPEGKALGMTVIGKRFRTPEDPRYNKRINTLATALLASQNAEMLIKAGLPVTGENLYMMHNIGPGIIPVMLGQPASDKTLKAMSQNGMTKNMTAADFLAFQKGRFNVAFAEANSSTSVAADSSQMAAGKTLDKKPKTASNVSTAKSPSVSGAEQKKTDLIRGPGSTIVRT